MPDSTAKAIVSKIEQEKDLSKFDAVPMSEDRWRVFVRKCCDDLNIPLEKSDVGKIDEVVSQLEASGSTNLLKAGANIEQARRELEVARRGMTSTDLQVSPSFQPDDDKATVGDALSNLEMFLDDVERSGTVEDYDISYMRNYAQAINQFVQSAQSNTLTPGVADDLTHLADALMEARDSMLEPRY